MRTTRTQSQDAMPKVTIGIPTLNRVGYLRLALESALAQTYENIEIVVSNNASTDETASYLASCTDPRLRILHQSTLLPAVENWNACVTAGTGVYFLLLSDDDMLEPNAIEELVAGYAGTNDSYPMPGIVYCGGHIIDAAGNVLRPFIHSRHSETAQELIPALFRQEREIWFCATLYRTADLLPGFPTSFHVSADFSAAIRAIIKYGTATFIPKELVRYRMHQNTTVLTPNRRWREDWKQLCEFAIEGLAQRNGPDPEFARQLRRLVQRHTILMIRTRISNSLHDHKWRALLEYGRNLPSFLSPFGLKNLFGGLLTLFVPDSTRSLLKKVRSGNR